MHAKKEKFRVEVYTVLHRIQADLHIFAGARLTDIMQSRETQSFFALTDVVVYDLAGDKELFKADFIDINRSHIVMVRPLQMPPNTPVENGY
jgi:Family of unknown function (DUF6812)